MHLRLRVVGMFAGVGVLTAIERILRRHTSADAFGRSPDMAGRSVICACGCAAIAQRPIGGWGWFIAGPRTWSLCLSFRQPLTRRDADSIRHTTAYVEAALTTGFVGAAMITVAIVWSLYRVVRVAVARYRRQPVDVIPAVIIIAMFIQSVYRVASAFRG